MVPALKVIRIGDAAGILLSDLVLGYLDAQVGDELEVNFTSDGIELSRAQPNFEMQMVAAREVMRRRKLALRELAK